MAYSKPPDRPSFFYHLGDVVYYDGESANYWPEFYEPYLNYHAPIVAIPGNHDGDVNPATGESSLQAFVRNFCAQSGCAAPHDDAAECVLDTKHAIGDDHRPCTAIVRKEAKSATLNGRGSSRNSRRPILPCL
jgi:hypothetical protein